MIYFDHAASTKVLDEAKQILLKSIDEDFANPSAAHKYGKSALKKIEKARLKILKLLKASKSDQLVFLGSATEGNNLVIKGLGIKDNEKIHFSRGDHPSTVMPALETNGIKTDISLNADGDIDEAKLMESLSDQSRLVVFSHVNNQSGNKYDILSLAKKIKNYRSDIHIHVDGVQAITKLGVDLSSFIDSYTISGHKIGAPKGVAALFLKNGIEINAQLHGGGHENGLRSSTLNTPMILALEYVIESGIKNITEKNQSVMAINELIRTKLINSGLDIKFPFPLEKTSPYILSFICPGVSSDIILRHLEMKDIFVASSSACSSRAKGYNEGFAAMKIDQREHKFVLRVSFSESSTIDEAEEFVREFENVVKEIKRIM
ncbi:cysteine desulfurase family protein [Halobacteriovorax sp. HLS]|uniref:cysteine desulfurase family protein n=1 Tax=Halobacteriovorax sp. HLS TaxID=2234000 RepID=UPI000FDC57E4|nr:aminotransferase class V-fold PLP-dependent enzyme [Halobacteriovorax sp. HLS]